MKNQISPHQCRGSFNTLAQTGTSHFEKPTRLIHGNGRELGLNAGINGLAKRKMIVQTMMLSLIDLAKSKHSPDRIKAYWNTYHCQNKVISVDGRLYGKYCKNRFCTLCCAIRKAEILNKYLPAISSWDSPFFVTLTIKAQPRKNLIKFMRGMMDAFQRIYMKIKKRHQRGKCSRIMGIKSLECNFNPVRKTYNPHFHIIVPDEETANILISEWLNIWTPKFALRAAQNKSKIKDCNTALIEIVKYGSKIFTEPDLKKKGKGKSSPLIYLAALDNIFNAMKGLRIFERFGFNLPKGCNIKPSNTFLAKDYQEWIYDLRFRDWHNSDNELLLTNYSPDSHLVNLLENNIDISTE